MSNQQQQPLEPAIRISLDSFYQEVRSLHESMARIETKLDALAGLEARVRELENLQLKEKTADQEDRLRALEERRLPHQLLGLAATVLGTAALIWQAVGHK